MQRTHPAPGIAAVIAVALLALGGCAAAASTQPTASPAADAPAESPEAPDTTTELGAVPEPLPTGEVLAQGLVLDAGTPILCLGDVGASLPPVCGGEPLVGWDWEAIDGWEQQGSTRWGSYAVQGTWDGATFTVSGDPIPLALYDPMAFPQPSPTASTTTSPEELQRIQQVLVDALGDRLLSAGVTDGRVDATVVFDDGTLQQQLDDAYGAGVVQVVSALREVGA